MVRFDTSTCITLGKSSCNRHPCSCPLMVSADVLNGGGSCRESSSRIVTIYINDHPMKGLNGWDIYEDVNV